MIVGGKTHRIYARLDNSFGNPPDAGNWKELGMLKEATFNSGRQREALETIGDNYKVGWGEGAAYHPSLKLTYQPAGAYILRFLRAFTAFDQSNVFKKEPWPVSVEVYTTKPSFKALAIWSGMAKTTTIAVQSLNSPVQISTELLGQMLQETDQYTGNYLSKYIGFMGSATNPFNIGSRTDVSKVALEGHHIRAYIKFKGESERKLGSNGYATNYSVTFNHELQEAIAEITGDDGEDYVCPAEYAIEKSSIQANFTMTAKNWRWWEDAEANKDIDYLKLVFNPPSASGQAPFTLKLKEGILQKPDLSIKAMAALGISVNMEFREAELT